MRKFTIIILALSFLICSLPAVAYYGSDEEPVELLNAEVTLLDKESVEHGFRLYVMLPDGELTVYAPPHGQFVSRANVVVTPEAFLMSYRNRRISIDFMDLGDSFLVVMARGR